MVFSWFKKRGGQDPSSNSDRKADKRAGNKAEPKGDGAQPTEPVTKAATSNPLALAAASVLQAEDPKLAQQALAQLTDPQVITYVALQQSNLRDIALELPQMRTEAALHVMEKQSRERNKGINRFARNSLEKIKTQRREASELRVRGEELNNALSKHNNESQQAQSLTYAQREAVVLQLQTQYSDNAAQYQQRVIELAACDITLEPLPAMEVVKLQPPEPEPEIAPTPAAVLAPVAATAAPIPDAAQVAELAQLSNDINALRQPLAKDTQTPGSAAAFADLMTKLPGLQQRWQTLGSKLDGLELSAELAANTGSTKTQLRELEQLTTACVALDELAQQQATVTFPTRPDVKLSEPSDETLSIFTSYQESITDAAKVSKQQLRKLSWPNWAQTNAAISAPFAQRDAIQAEQRWIEEQKQALNNQLDSVLDGLTESLDGGQATQSKTQMGQVRRLKQALGKLNPDQNARFNTLNSRLTELVDWQTYATGPKRQELLDAMTLIATEPLEPEAQATRVKQLRSQWNELGSVSKAGDRRLAERFNAQAQTAFDHCREHFAQLAEQRAANTAQREQICEQLSDYINTTNLTNGDVKAAEQILRTAREAWRQCYPVERKTSKPLEKKFEGLQEQLHEKIKAVWTANEAAKQGLLETAQALAAATESDLGERINQAKGLQKQWQQIGPMPRGGERKLWLAFREACDALFNERDGAKQEQQAADQAAVAALTTQVDAFAEQLSSTSASDASAEQLRNARKAFSETQGNVPSAAYNQIKRRFDALCKDYEGLLQVRQRQALHKRIEDLAIWDTATTSAGSDAALPENADAKLLQGLTSAPTEAPTIESLQRLVLVAEILAEVPSPPADEALRLQVQVERLQQSMGQQSAVANNSGDAQWVELALQWCAQRPKPQEEAVSALQQRYFAALRSALTAD